MNIQPRRMNQDEFIHEYNDKNREQFNPKLFERNEYDIVREIEKVILSCERNRYFTLKVKSFRVIENYEEIHDTLYDHEDRKNWRKNKDGKKKVDNPYDYIPLRDSDIMLLEVIYYIKINNGKEPDPHKPDDIYNYERDLQVLIAIPRYVDKYYVRINGTEYNPLIQIVDRSVYNNAASGSGKRNPSNTQKTMFQPIRMFRTYYNLRTYNDETVQGILYTTNVFSKTMDGMKYLLAKYGLYGCMEYLDLPYIHYSTEPICDEQYYSFGTKDGKLFITTPRYIFDNEPMVQSLITTIVRNVAKFYKQTEFDSIFDPQYWMCSLGGEFNAFNIEKGITVLDSIEDAYDLKTKEILKLPMEDKNTIYDVLRWMFREFNALRGKDIYDVSAKRGRIAEYFANVYAVKLTRGLYRVTDMGKNVTMNKIIGAIYTSPMYLLTAITGYKLLRYRDMVNDNDALAALSYPYKGISGLGDQGNTKKKKQKQAKAAVPIGFKLVQPSQIGVTDMDTSSPSDPGVTGMMCPMCDMNDDGSFVEYEEPNSWRDTFAELSEQYNNLVGMQQAIEFKKKLHFDYDYIKEDMVKETLKTYNELFCPVIDRNGIIDYSIPPITSFDDITIGEDPQYGEFVQLNFGNIIQ